MVKTVNERRYTVEEFHDENHVSYGGEIHKHEFLHRDKGPAKIATYFKSVEDCKNKSNPVMKAEWWYLKDAQVRKDGPVCIIKMADLDCKFIFVEFWRTKGDASNTGWHREDGPAAIRHNADGSKIYHYWYNDKCFDEDKQAWENYKLAG